MSTQDSLGTPQAAPLASDASQQITVHRLYVKSSVFEAAAMTLALLQETKPPIVEFQAQVNWLERDKTLYEATLNLTLIAKHNDNIVWRVQLSHAGLFTLTGFGETQRELVLNGYCMNLLYPYVCETAANLVAKGGFPPLYLAPMNFEVLHRQQQAKEKSEAIAPMN